MVKDAEVILGDPVEETEPLQEVKDAQCVGVVVRRNGAVAFGAVFVVGGVGEAPVGPQADVASTGGRRRASPR